MRGGELPCVGDAHARGAATAMRMRAGGGSAGDASAFDLDVVSASVLDSSVRARAQMSDMALERGARPPLPRSNDWRVFLLDSVAKCLQV